MVVKSPLPEIKPTVLGLTITEIGLAQLSYQTHWSIRSVIKCIFWRIMHKHAHAFRKQLQALEQIDLKVKQKKKKGGGGGEEVHMNYHNEMVSQGKHTRV